MAVDPFLWGRAGAKLTPEQIARDREAADALAKGAMDYSPIGHWSQGLSRVAQGLLAGLDYRTANAAEDENATYNTEIINSLLGGAPAAAAMPSTTGVGAELSATSPAVDFSVDPTIKTGIAETASALGIDPVDLATAISYETAGTFDPTKAGPTTQWGQHKGLIQFGEPQAAQYGVDWNNPIGSQLGPEGAVAKYLRSAGVQPGMGMMDIYSAINAGRVGREGASDANNGGAPGTVADKVNQQMAGHRAKALALFPPETAAATPEAAIEAAAPASGYVDPMVSAPNAAPQTAEAPPLPAPVEVAPAPAVAAVPQQVAQAITPQTPAINPAILRALTDPRATPQTRAVAQALMQQEARKQEALQEQQTWMARQQYEQQQQSSDPLRQLQIRKAQMEIDSANQPKRQPLINAGNGNVYDPNSGEWIQAPGTGQEKLPDSVRALELRAERAGLKPGTPEYNQFMISGGSGGTSLSVGPNGEVNFTQGGAVKPLTEAQSKDAVYATRATNALPLLNKYEDSLLSLSENMADGVPMNLGRYAQSEEYQVARDAGRDFLATILRKDTGAAITQQEEEIYGKMFLPQPGDKPAAIQAKKQRRTLAVEAIKAGMPTNAIENMAKALEVVPASTAVETDGEVPPAPDGIDPNDWKFMTPAERKLFQ